MILIFAIAFILTTTFIKTFFLLKLSEKVALNLVNQISIFNNKILSNFAIFSYIFIFITFTTILVFIKQPFK